MRLIDTHCHLDSIKGQTVTESVQLAKNAGVDTLITIAVSPDNLDRVIEIAEQFPNVWTTQGVHPHDAKAWDASTPEKIIANSKHQKVLAIGEIGLDYHYDFSPRATQQTVFESQLALAIKLNLPIVLHTREAEEDTIAILNNFEKELHGRCLFHSYTSNKTLAEYGLKQNFYFGFNGIVTFKAAENVREILAEVPLERLLLETDAPYLSPTPHRGKENGPHFLPLIAEFIANQKKLSLEELAAMTFKNAEQFFKKEF